MTYFSLRETAPWPCLGRELFSTLVPGPEVRVWVRIRVYVRVRVRVRIEVRVSVRVRVRVRGSGVTVTVRFRVRNIFDGNKLVWIYWTGRSM